MLRTSFLILLTFGAFLGTASGIRTLVPSMLKLEWYASEGASVDVIFLGSSFTYRQLDPAIFDEVRGAEKTGARSLNLGTQGMRLLEQAYHLRRILEDKPEDLDWVVVEAQPFLVALSDSDFLVRRTIRWHDARATWQAIQACREWDLPEEERRDLMKRHLEHWRHRALNLGLGTEAVQTLSKGRLWIHRDDLGELGASADGYFPLQVATAGEGPNERRKRFLSGNKAVLFKAPEVLRKAGDGGPPSAPLLDVVRELEALAEEKGVGLVWWIHPKLERIEGWRQLHEDGEIDCLIPFDVPELYPDLYTMKGRFDLHHLRRGASEMLTEELAREFVQYRREADAR